MACTALLGVLLFHPATAGAQSADSAKIERLERQTELLQRQLKEIQQELAQTRRKTKKVEAKVDAAPARYSAGPPAGGYAKGPLPPPPPERVKVTLGGFIAAESVWRSSRSIFCASADCALAVAGWNSNTPKSAVHAISFCLIFMITPSIGSRVRPPSDRLAGNNCRG